MFPADFFFFSFYFLFFQHWSDQKLCGTTLFEACTESIHRPATSWSLTSARILRGGLTEADWSLSPRAAYTCGVVFSTSRLNRICALPGFNVCTGTDQLFDGDEDQIVYSIISGLSDTSGLSRMRGIAGNQKKLERDESFG